MNENRVTMTVEELRHNLDRLVIYGYEHEMVYIRNEDGSVCDLKAVSLVVGDGTVLLESDN